ncbi:MAG: DNA starvation/stationary phase protection protein, partial [Idiomarina sp.]|nr:DNA starvation/stationary phase protection protein [Idiomarina sp.]
MKQLSVIGLDKKKAEQLGDKLNELLSNYQVFYMNVRGFHWNIKGERFFELHAKFEETYDDLLLKIDEIAERILTLGQRPQHAYSTYIKNS